MRRLGLLLLCLVLACDRDKAPEAETPEPASEPEPEPAAEPEPEPEPQPEPEPDGRDFISELRFLSQVTTCGGDGPASAPISERGLRRHCERLGGDIESYRERWLARAEPFFAEHVPDGLPGQVVYPFAGGDLLTVLAVFPDFDELTTLSLEPAGDPRRVRTMPAHRFRQALRGVRIQLHNLLVMNHNLTKKMITHFRGGGLPGHLIFTLAALEIHGLEPRAAYYFELAPDGSIDYLTADEIAGFPDDESASERNSRFGNIEIHFGEPGSPETRIYRHILANLDNEHLAAEPGALAHLEAKGEVAMITKAASYLLWWDSFSTIRSYMLEHMAWMVSDSTGIPPSMARPAGFEIETWGRFNRPILDPSDKLAAEMRRLWRSQPRRRLRFRFGYPDSDDNHHLMITRPASD